MSVVVDFVFGYAVAPSPSTSIAPVVVNLPASSNLLPYATITAGLLAVIGVVWSAHVQRVNANKDRENALDRTKQTLEAARVAREEERDEARRQRAEDFDEERRRRDNDQQLLRTRRFEDKIIGLLADLGLALDAVREAALKLEPGQRLQGVLLITPSRLINQLDLYARSANTRDALKTLKIGLIRYDFAAQEVRKSKLDFPGTLNAAQTVLQEQDRELGQKAAIVKQVFRGELGIPDYLAPIPD